MSSWINALLPACLCFLFACSQADAFPSEQEMTSRLRRGMTTDEVVAAFGQPSNGVPRLPGVTHMRYFPPLALLTVEKEGYLGFEVELVDGRVTTWRAIRGNPSYAPMTGPPGLKLFGWLFRIFLAGAAVYAVTLGLMRWQSETRSMIAAYTNRKIPTRELPVEFRFITHETTLQQVIDVTGPYSQTRKFPISPRVVTTGYAYTDDSFGRPAIILFEWELPFNGAVILMPEYPFTSDSRIRAAFCRASRPDEPTGL